MKIVEDSPSLLTALDRPNSYIGRSVPRPNLARLTQGRAQYVSDVVLPRMAHVAFVRSPHAHARIKSIDTAAAKKSSGVIAVVTGAGDPDKGFAEADAVVETTFMFGRHTGVTNEPRAIVADWNPGEARLTVYQGTQAPHMMQNLFAKHLSLEEHQVRVVTKDVGGSFGIKVHTYADEMATVALSRLLKRPIKFVGDRIERFVTDIHSHDHPAT